MRHNEMMESARKKSDETIDHLKRKLNSLQEVSPVVFEWLKCYQSGLSETLFSLSCSKFHCEKRGSWCFYCIVLCVFECWLPSCVSGPLQLWCPDSKRYCEVKVTISCPIRKSKTFSHLKQGKGWFNINVFLGHQCFLFACWWMKRRFHSAYGHSFRDHNT